jgi:predicted metal-dependent hydrolase
VSQTYTIRRHRRARSLKISVTSQGAVVVTAPHGIPEFLISQFVKHHQDWIQRTQAAQHQKPHPVTEDTVQLFGKKYELVLTTDIEKPLGVFVQGERVVVNQSRHVAARERAAKTKLTSFLKRTAESYLRPRTHALAKTMNTTFGRLTLREQKTRWGSCSSQGNLNFNWRLVHYPPAIIDYVIIHELAHRHHMNHSTKFWEEVSKYDSEYRQHRLWLKRNGLSVG